MFSGKNEYNKKTNETFHLIKREIRLQGYDESVMVFRVVTDKSRHIKIKITTEQITAAPK